MSQMLITHTDNLISTESELECAFNEVEIKSLHILCRVLKKSEQCVVPKKYIRNSSVFSLVVCLSIT